MQSHTSETLSTSIEQLRKLSKLNSLDAIKTLSSLATALPTCGSPERLEEIAHAIPEHVASLSPEVCLALQQLAGALLLYSPKIPQDIAALEPQLYIGWLRLQLSLGDEACLESLGDDLLLRVMTGWSSASIFSPKTLLLRCARSDEPRLRRYVLQWLESTIQHLALTPKEAFDCLEPLLSDPKQDIQKEALGFLSRSWLRDLSPLQHKTREKHLKQALFSDTSEIVQVALQICAQTDLRTWIQDVLQDESHSIFARSESIRLLGPLAQANDLEYVLQLATKEPLRYGPAARLYLLEAHRHGLFLREEHLDDALWLFDQHPLWSAQEFVRVTYIARNELIPRLTLLPLDDHRWLRRAELLSESIHTQAHHVIEDLLQKAEDPEIAAALLQAAGKSPGVIKEEALLRWLDVLPKETISVLRVKGGARSINRLKALVEDPFCTSSLRRSALSALWALSKDRQSLLKELSTQLGPHESSLLEKQRITPQDNRIALLLREKPWEENEHNHIPPIDQLKIFCESGEIELLDEVQRLFRTIFRGYVRLALAGDFTVKRLLIPELEQMVFRYGRHLIANGRHVRRWREDNPETGRDLLLLFALDWLQEEPTEAICVALLEVIGRHEPDGAILRQIEPFWRHKHKEIQRAALEALIQAGEDARGLELSICKLTEATDPRIVTQALSAVKELRARWAEPTVLQALVRPEMAIKKEAAEALTVVGSDAAVPTIVGWLAHHDNGAFRTSLKNALRKISNTAYVAVLLDALDGEQETRRKHLLWDALSGQLALQTVLRLARRAQHQDLIEACLAGDVSLSDCNKERLETQLHRARLLPTKEKKDPTATLRLHGFSAEAAIQLIETRDPKLDNLLLPTIRAGIANWITWIQTSPQEHLSTALTLVLSAVNNTQHEFFDPLLALIEQHITLLKPHTIVQFFERCLRSTQAMPHQKLHAIELLRALPPSQKVKGTMRYKLLGDLGAIHTRDDLDVCLAECKLSPNVAHESSRLLSDVLSIPYETKNEPSSLTQLREQANEWFQTPTDIAHEWLTSTLKERPLGLPPLPKEPHPHTSTHTQQTQQDLERLCSLLHDDKERERAASELLRWKDVQHTWDEILELHLLGKLDLDDRELDCIATRFKQWPKEQARWPAARQLLWRISPHQQQVFLRGWLEAWTQGDTEYKELLQSMGQEHLLPILTERILQGEYSLLRLLQADNSLALRSLIQFVAPKAPGEVQHLLKKESKEEDLEQTDDKDDPVDPIAGKSLEELVKMLKEKSGPHGLAVRALHATTAFGERSIATLESLVTDKRPQIRSAALRALRKVASKEQTCHAATQALKMETRRDVICQLMTSLAHARHEPAVSEIIERTTHKDLHIRKAARAALLTWGEAAIPLLQHATRRTRPDRREDLNDLIEKLQPN